MIISRALLYFRRREISREQIADLMQGRRRYLPAQTWLAGYHAPSSHRHWGYGPLRCSSPARSLQIPPQAPDLRDNLLPVLVPRTCTQQSRRERSQVRPQRVPNREHAAGTGRSHERSRWFYGGGEILWANWPGGLEVDARAA